MQKQNYTRHSIRTYSGKVFDLELLEPDSICIEDIAHGLAYTARFAGQLKSFYSVAQHSFYAFQNASQENRLAALMHDAAEAYIGDMPSPFKSMMPDYRFIEERLMKAISDRFGFVFPLAEEVKEIDKYLFGIEWNGCVLDLIPVESWDPETAKRRFLEAFETCKKNLQDEN